MFALDHTRQRLHILRLSARMEIRPPFPYAMMAFAASSLPPPPRPSWLSPGPWALSVSHPTWKIPVSFAPFQRRKWRNHPCPTEYHQDNHMKMNGGRWMEGHFHTVRFVRLSMIHITWHPYRPRRRFWCTDAGFSLSTMPMIYLRYIYIYMQSTVYRYTSIWRLSQRVATINHG